MSDAHAHDRLTTRTVGGLSVTGFMGLGAGALIGAAALAMSLIPLCCAYNPSWGQRLLDLAAAFGLAAGVGLFGAVNLALARAIDRRKRWAWSWTVAIGSIYLVTPVAPLGALLLWTMLRGGMRARWVDGVEAPRAF